MHNIRLQDIEDSRSIRSNPGSESHSASADETSSGDSIDSGVVLRMAKMFGEVEGGRAKESCRISRESNNSDLCIFCNLSEPPLSSPVPPPRPKRTSMLISTTNRAHSASPGHSRWKMKWIILRVFHMSNTMKSSCYIIYRNLFTF